jgi:DNA-binding Xre family transcriptional regulator
MAKHLRLELIRLLERDGYLDSRGRILYKKLGEDLQFSGVTLWKMIHDKNYKPSVDTLEKLCKFFKCTPNDLFGIEEIDKAK